MGQSKVIYIAIEHFRREFDAKLLVAQEAAERGYSVVLASSMSLKKSIKDLPPGVLIHKALGGKFAVDSFSLLKNNGHSVIVLDEEGLIFRSAEVYVRNRVKKELVPLVDRVLAWGDYHQSVLEGSGYVPNAKIRKVGNPRFDLCRLRGSIYSSKKPDDTKVILFNTRFPLVNGIRSLSENISNLRKLGVISTEKDMEDTLKSHQRDSVLAESFFSLIEKISAEFPESRIIVRPHPDENTKIYQEKLSSFHNVEIDAGAPLMHQLALADVIIHEGCTTAIEAAVMGKPVLAFVPSEPVSESLALPNLFSEQFQEPKAIVDRVKELLLNEGFERDVILPKEAIGYLHNAFGEYSYKQVVDCLDELDVKPVSLSDVVHSVRKGKKDIDRFSRAKLIYYWVLGKIFPSRNGSYSKKSLEMKIKDRKFPVASLNEVRGRLAEVLRLVGKDASSFYIGRVHGRAFLIRTKSP